MSKDIALLCSPKYDCQRYNTSYLGKLWHSAAMKWKYKYIKFDLALSKINRCKLELLTKNHLFTVFLKKNTLTFPVHAPKAIPSQVFQSAPYTQTFREISITISIFQQFLVTVILTQRLNHNPKLGLHDTCYFKLFKLLNINPLFDATRPPYPNLITRMVHYTHKTNLNEWDKD